MLHRGHPGDIDFYRRISAESKNVLELGCGDGRVSIPLAESGLSVTGLELHPGMLRAAMAARAASPSEIQSRLRFICADISAFAIDERFDRVIAPYTTLYALDPAARRSCLQCIERHLENDGLFVFDVYPAEWIHAEGSYADPEPILISRLVDERRTIDVYEQDVHDVDTQRVSVTYTHQIHDESSHSTLQYTIEHTYLLVEQFEPVLNACGLELQSIHGDFAGSVVDENAERLVVTARRSG